MPQYEKTLTVVTEDLDELAHVNNVRYLDWIQDISKEHWNALVSNDPMRIPENVLAIFSDEH